MLSNSLFVRGYVVRDFIQRTEGINLIELTVNFREVQTEVVIVVRFGLDLVLQDNDDDTFVEISEVYLVFNVITEVYWEHFKLKEDHCS